MALCPSGLCLRCLDSPVLYFDCASLAPELAKSAGLATARLGSHAAAMVEVKRGLRGVNEATK